MYVEEPEQNGTEQSHSDGTDRHGQGWESMDLSIMALDEWASERVTDWLSVCLYTHTKKNIGDADADADADERIIWR